MMTRKAFARQEESQLQLVLQELKASKELVKQLNRERDDNEKELLDVLDRNNTLRKELSELHSANTIICEERNRLQLIIDGFDQCRDEYEQALRHIAALDQQLHEANNHICHLESNNTKLIASQNQSLFEELVNSAPSLVSTTPKNDPCTKINLTDNDSIDLSGTKRSVGCSGNKLKKYIKINKYISKTRKLIKCNQQFMKKTNSVKERMCLLEQLNTCSAVIEENRLTYEKNITSLNSKILSLQQSLTNMTQNYERSKKEIREYILALKCLSDVSTSDSTNSRKRHSLASGLGASESLKHKPVCEPIVSKTSETLTSSHSSNPLKLKHKCIKNVMFSDEIGKNFGQLLNTYSGLNFTNNCFPGLTLYDIMLKILSTKFDNDTNLIIFVGNRGKVNKKTLINFYNKLCLLNVRKVVIFTLPYSCSLPQEENNLRYKCNLNLDTMSLYSDNFLKIIDINTILNKFYLTRGKYYLTNYFKRQIAFSLSFFIDNIAMSLARPSASIEQSPIDIHNISLEYVPNNLN